MRSTLGLLLEPVPAEKKRLLGERWAALDPRLRAPGQGFGRQATGCGATIGVLPKCDFDCQGCYLGADANSIPRFPLAEIFRQLEELRRHLGPKGNVQLTDGEVTLMPEAELAAIVRRARALGLSPMLMTHGDTFRRRPRFLPRLVRAGLREVSIHVDSLQRGRRGGRQAACERELMPLREELAALVRATRLETGVRLRAATTLTISRDNLDEVPAVVEWCLRHRDAFGLVSFQPLAQVGRTRGHLLGVDAAELWRRIGAALGPYGFDGAERGPLRFGHPDCTRIEPMAVYERRGGCPVLLPIARPGHREDLAFVERFFERGLGGLNFRDDGPAERACRALGALLGAPGFFLGEARRWVAARASETGTSLLGMLRELATGRARLDSFVVVSHHFMSRAELVTPAGRERLAACVLRLAIGGEMVPMCQVNASGLREAVYARGSAAVAPSGVGEPARHLGAVAAEAGPEATL